MLRTRTVNIERATTMIDAQLLDVLAQIEGLLRHGREIQRELLRLRGVPLRTPRRHPSRGSAHLEELVGEMVSENVELTKVLRGLRASVRQL